MVTLDSGGGGPRMAEGTEHGRSSFAAEAGGNGDEGGEWDGHSLLRAEGRQVPRHGGGGNE